jgi:hypothetical protein
MCWLIENEKRVEARGSRWWLICHFLQGTPRIIPPSLATKETKTKIGTDSKERKKENKFPGKNVKA